MELRRLWKNGNSVVTVLPPTVLKHIRADVGEWILFTFEENSAVRLEKVTSPNLVPELESGDRIQT